jgi:hypothetical protein
MQKYLRGNPFLNLRLARWVIVGGLQVGRDRGDYGSSGAMN